MPGKRGRPPKLKAEHPGNVKSCDWGSSKKPMENQELQRVPFNGAVQFEKNLTNAGIKAKWSKRHPIINTKYRITDGRYKGEMCKVELYKMNDAFVTVQFLDAWMQPFSPERRDMIPTKYLGLVENSKAEKSDDS